MMLFFLIQPSGNHWQWLGVKVEEFFRRYLVVQQLLNYSYCHPLLDFKGNEFCFNLETLDVTY
jgi:hypothetical protein